MRAVRGFLVLSTLVALAGCEDASVVGGRTDGGADVGLFDAPALSDLAPAHDDVVGDVATDGPMPCRSDMDCERVGLRVCDMGRCVECLPSIDDCPAGRYCDGATNRCVAGCRNDDGCATVDAGTAPPLRCDTVTHACVQCSVHEHCRPGNVCTGGRCVPGCTPARPCPVLEMCCDGQCADPSMSTAHCGACGNACNPANATPVCSAGRCTVGACAEGYGDCDRNGMNGCETSLQTSLAHCGRCASACATLNGTAACVMGACTITCAAGFADCNRNTKDGCEVEVRASPDDCGGCGRRCALEHATAGCVMGACTVANCDEGYRDCDMSPSNGCEVNASSDAAHCGRCGNGCPPGAACVMGACAGG